MLSARLQTIGGGLSLAYNPAMQTLGSPLTALTSIGTDRKAGSILPNGLTACPLKCFIAHACAVGDCTCFTWKTAYSVTCALDFSLLI